MSELLLTTYQPNESPNSEQEYDAQDAFLSAGLTVAKTALAQLSETACGDDYEPEARTQVLMRRIS